MACMRSDTESDSSALSDIEPESAPYFLDIKHALGSVVRPGTFATGGTVQFSFPVLKINGIPGTIGLPICDSQAKEIINQSSRAPFGRGEETIVDINVRCTWQLGPTQFSINNPGWGQELNRLIKQVQEELGCDSSQNVTCQLYKLLLYEPGGFFKVT